ncbi:hypothetical protein GLAREA_05638 [Glarea lozoyensis ATCC 20868]|uniref:SWIM-type domain-containing protein n=1 Tax=Glarea lozoyensis (strain ATCC 20868 / MF5171) TaxID=1116229 RepID=S3DEZ5_GLAL2|nr:uncharacterized protein GLAREA_05638 [Glarea lozoyensis ATCC 20868]EPE36300.1 hypothetical protein GLAREA_05638 [Glarea lozoyensis ATCC 20868]
MSTLPTPRQLITNLINTLTESPQTPPPQIQSTNTNPLKHLPPSHRKILSTLHVLLPPGMLLQALDLLDRGLVTRVMQTTSELPSQEPTSENQRALERQERNEIYTVSSSQPQKRFSSSTTQIYHVRLEAWNCTCAAFTFSAFPSYGATIKPWEHPPHNSNGAEEKMERDGWEFGGLSQDEGVVVCKHLLACLLVERWGDVLGGMVKERRVGREEMAGLGGE